MLDELEQAKIKLRKELSPERAFADPLSTDRWVANSLLQKSIRRGEAEVAQRAALTFLDQGGSAIWRRFIIIAFEDLGAASPDVLAMTVGASTDANWRKRSGGNHIIATSLARLLAEAPKSRSAEHLITSSGQHPSFEQERRLVGSSSTAANLGIVADKSNSVALRALSAWCASSIGWKRERASSGDLPGLLDIFRALGVPEELVAVTGIAAVTSREPMTLMVPLLWLMAKEQVPAVIVSECPPTMNVDGVPLYALDKHTRTGREAIRELVKSNPAIRECLKRYVAPYQHNDAAYMAAFYADAAPLASKRSWQGADRLERWGTEADLLQVGVP
jgi:hypothetical protein